MCTGSCSTPRQGLPGDRQGPPWFLWNHSRTKCSSREDKAPARGACREGQGPGKRSLPGGPAKKLNATRRASRQDPASDKLSGATRQRPRQGACRGEATSLRPRSSASNDVSPQDRSWRTWRAAVQPSGARWQVEMTRRPSWQAVAPLTVALLHYLGDADGH